MSSGATVPIKLMVSGQGTVTAAFGQVQKAGASLASSLGRIVPALTGIAGLGGAIAGVGLGLKKVIDEGGKLNDLTARTGLSVKSLIRWREVFEESGKSAEDIGSTFDKVSKSIYAAATAGGPAELALAKLGLEAKSLSTLAPEVQFETLAGAVGKIANPTERAAVAMQIFGKSGGDLLPVFESMQDLSGVDGALGRLPEVLGRNVKVLDGIGDSFTQLHLKSTQLFAGIVDQIAPLAQSVLDEMTKIDLTGLGQKVGAFVNLAVDSWKEGRFGEFVALSVEAGFEQANNWARASFRSLAEWVGKGDFWGSVTLGLVTAVNEGMKSISAGIGKLQVLTDALWDYVEGSLTHAFLSAANALGEALKTVFNQALSGISTTIKAVFNTGLLPHPLKEYAVALDAVMKASVRPLTYTPKETAAPDFGVLLSKASAAHAGDRAEINSFFDNSTNAARALLGVGGISGESFDASKKLSGLISEMVAKREAAAAAEKKTTGAMAPQIPIASRLAGIREQEAETLKKMRTLEEQRAAVTGSYTLTQAQKWSENLRLLTAQREELEKMVGLLREKAKLPGLTEQERTQLSSRADTFDNKLSGVNKELGSLGPNPNSLLDQMRATFTSIQDEFGTLAQNIAGIFKSVIGAAVDSISAGLQRLIGDTEYWTQKLGKVAGPIMGALTGALAKMVTQMVVGFILQQTIGRLITKSAAKDAATLATAWAPAAVAASIATEGSAAAVGLASSVGAMALGTSAAAALAIGGGSFQGGGYTGHGPRDQVAGVAHRDEVVFEAPVVDRLGLGNLMALRASAKGGGAPLSAAPSSGPTFNLATFDSRPDFRKWAESNEGETWVLDVVTKNFHRFRS